MKRIIFHAPGIHVGGGAVLFNELLEAAHKYPNVLIQMDARAASLHNTQYDFEHHYIQPSIWGRLRAEWRLWRRSTSTDIILCFHGMPPLFPSRGTAIVFLQNRLTLGGVSASDLTPKVKFQIFVKKLMHTLLKRNADKYVVQTKSMKAALEEWHGGSPNIHVIPFMKQAEFCHNSKPSDERFDFIYVADGVGHKNHMKLLEAWKLLSNEKLYPSLLLTLPNRDKVLIDNVALMVSQYNLKVTNYAGLSHDEVTSYYQSSGALVFPSLTESFGLPLLEAKTLGVPIVASELDYVRDVCEPAETFDPNSAISIVRAVKRFMGIKELPLNVRSAAEFLSEISI